MVFPNFSVEPIRCTRSLVTKNEAVVLGKLHFPEALGGMRGEQPKFLWSDGAGAKRWPVGVFMDIERLPIIHAGTSEISIVDDESKGMNQMKAGSRQRAHPSNVARVRGDFRLE